MSQNLHIPQLPPQPAQAIDETQFLYEQLIDEVGIENVLVIGSSLGGYYATYLAEHFGGKSVLINPAVKPYELLLKYLGENKNYHNDDTFMVTQEYIDELKSFEIASLRFPEHHFLLCQTHDESLDYRQATTKYRNSPSIIEYGGNHGFVNYPQRLPSIMNFARAAY